MEFSSARAVLTRAFQEIDTNGDGYIDAFEMEEVFKKFYKDKNKTVDYEKLKNKVLAFMKKVDKNGDKQISLEEFLEHFLQFH